MSSGAAKALPVHMPSNERKEDDLLLASRHPRRRACKFAHSVFLNKLQRVAATIACATFEACMPRVTVAVR